MAEMESEVKYKVEEVVEKIWGVTTGNTNVKEKSEATKIKVGLMEPKRIEVP